MKFFPNIPPHSRRTGVSAFTLVEVMISLTVYLIIFIGVIIAIQIFALRVYQLAATKISATAYGRKALNQIRDDIRQAKTLRVGNVPTSGDPTLFSPTTNNTAAQGNALQIFQTTNGAPSGVPYTIYYLDQSQSITGTN